MVTFVYNMHFLYNSPHSNNTVVPALGDSRRERPPAVYGHVINAPTHFNVPIRPSGL